MDWTEVTKFLETEFLGSKLFHYLSAAAIFIVVISLLFGLKKSLLKIVPRLRLAPQLLSFVQELVEAFSAFVFLVIALHFSLRFLDLPELWARRLSSVVFGVVVLQVLIILSKALNFLIANYRFGNLAHDDLSTESARKNLSAIGQVVLWLTGVLFFLSNLGIDITTLVTGLGIGGIAVALAAQSLLGDIFSSFVIAVDKPFAVSDFIVLGDLSGTVEHIGLKTTRIRSLSGELIIVGNSDLTSARVKNYRKMKTRRICFKIGVTYDTPVEKLKKLPELFKQAILAAPKTIFERAHFLEFGASSLNYEIIYFVEDREFLSYAEAQEAINLTILDEFAKLGVDMAFPTQTVYLTSGVEQKGPQPKNGVG